MSDNAKEDWGRPPAEARARADREIAAERAPFSPAVDIDVGLPLAALERQNALDSIRGALGRLREEIERAPGMFQPDTDSGVGLCIEVADVLAAIDRQIEELGQWGRRRSLSAAVS